MFVVGKPVLGNNFFDRTEMKQQVANFILSNQDFMIKAPRRYGKTSIIKEALKEKQYIYIDIRRVSSISLVPNDIIDKAYNIGGISNITQKIKTNVVSFLTNIKSEINIDLAIIQASAQYLTKERESNPCEDLIFALNTVNEIAKSIKKPITIVFDEFQDIKKFKCKDNDILEMLRGCLQHLEFVHCIFLGSIETIMSNIFENRKSPFFNYCRKLKLEEFDIPELYEELLVAFNRKNIIFEENRHFKKVLERLKGHPANTMIVMQNIYYLSLENQSPKNGQKRLLNKELDAAYKSGYFEMMDLIEQYIIEIKDKRHYHDTLYKMVNNQKQTLTPQALHQVRTGLMNIGCLHKDREGKYQIIDNFLYEYLDENGVKE